MNGIIKGVISIVFSVILVVNVLIPTFKNANQTNWTSGEVALFSLGSLASIAGLVYGVLAVFGIA